MNDFLNSQNFRAIRDLGFPIVVASFFIWNAISVQAYLQTTLSDKIANEQKTVQLLSEQNQKLELILNELQRK